MKKLRNFIVVGALLSSMAGNAEPIPQNGEENITVTGEKSLSLQRVEEHKRHLDSILTNLQKLGTDHPIVNKIRQDIKFLKEDVRDMIRYLEIGKVDDLYIIYRAYRAYFSHKELLTNLHDLGFGNESKEIMSKFEKEKFLKKMMKDMINIAILHIKGKSPLMSEDAPIDSKEWAMSMSEFTDELQKEGLPVSKAEIGYISDLVKSMKQLEACKNITGLTSSISFNDPTLPKIKELQNKLQNECFSGIGSQAK